MYLEQRSRKRGSSACPSWSWRFSRKVLCCITALLIWLFRKSSPRSMRASVERAAESAHRGPPLARAKPRANAQSGSAVAVDHVGAQREERRREADPVLRGDDLEAVQQLALDAAPGLALRQRL